MAKETESNEDRACAEELPSTSPLPGVPGCICAESGGGGGREQGKVKSPGAELGSVPQDRRACMTGVVSSKDGKRAAELVRSGAVDVTSRTVFLAFLRDPGTLSRPLRLGWGSYKQSLSWRVQYPHLGRARSHRIFRKRLKQRVKIVRYASSKDDAHQDVQEIFITLRSFWRDSTRASLGPAITESDSLWCVE